MGFSGTVANRLATESGISSKEIKDRNKLFVSTSRSPMARAILEAKMEKELLNGNSSPLRGVG